MKLCIHRGTQEIGGTCVEIQAQGKRIVLDVGLPLDVADPDALPLHPIPGFDKPDTSLLGVVISHPHQDHYGLAHRLPKETTFLIGKAAAAILEAAELFTPAGLKLDNVIHLEDRVPIRLGPFTITPYLVDHSAYDSYAVLVDVEGKRLFYSGDLRFHGRKAALMQRLLDNPPREVDVLLMEGTTLGRPQTEKGFPSESDLEQRLVELFKATSGMPLVWASGQNIDRLVTIFRACKKSGRQFIIDMYTAHILKATGNEHVPQADWEGIRVFLPKSQKIRILRNHAFDVANAYRPYRIFPEHIPEAAPHSVMLFRPSMMQDMERAACLDGASLIYSLWPGYLERKENQPLLDWLEKHGLPLHHCHTSGHAAVADLKKLREAFAKAPVVPIHLEDREAFGCAFKRVEARTDGEWWSPNAPQTPI